MSPQFGKLDHLPPTVAQQLVGAGPAILEDEGVVPDLPLVDQVGAGGDRDGASIRARPRRRARPGPAAEIEFSLRTRALSNAGMPL